MLNTTLIIITCIICGFCFIFFVVMVIKLSVKKKRLIKGIQDIKRNIETTSNPAKKVYNEYLAAHNGKDYTSEYASDYINIDSIASAYGINLKFINIIPNILTSIGILGTFIGLSVAVYGFDSETAEGIKESIQTLLSGMSTAFITSVSGMFFSIVFLWIEKVKINNINKFLEDFCSNLDKQYHCSIDNAVIKSFSTVGDNDKLYSPSETLQFIRKSVETMRVQLETFGTDICDNIGNALDASFQGKLVPIINELSAKLENPAQALTDGLINEFRNICNGFNSQVTQSVNDTMEDLLERFIDASNAIMTIPDTLNIISQGLDSSAKNTIHATQALSDSLDKQTVRINDLSDLFVNSLGELTDVSANIADLHTKLKVMPDAVSKASTAITLAANNINESQSSVDVALRGIKQYTENIQTIQNNLSEIFAEIQDGLTQYSETVKQSLKGLLEPFTSSVTEATEGVANAIAPLNDAVTDLGSFNDFVKEMLIGIESSFKPIEEALKQLAKIKQEAFNEMDNSNN